MSDAIKSGDLVTSSLEKFFHQNQEKFSHLTANKQRLAFLQTYIKGTSDRFIQDNKNDEEAVIFRMQGNVSFRGGEYIKALKTYTASITKAKNKTFKALAYANRSAVLFKLKLYRECILDIDRALENDYPEDLKAKLTVRRQNSTKLQEYQQHPVQVPKIPTSQKNHSIQSASDCVKIENNKQYGRLISATRDIQIGELVAVEEPYACMLIDEYMIYCHECASLCYSLIPCDDCTQALYCSKSCKDKAYNNYHKYECAILLSMNALTTMKNALAFALKVTFLARKEYIQSKYNSNDSTYYSDRYKEISSLLPHTDKRTTKVSFVMTCLSLVVYNLVKTKTSYFSDCKNNEQTFKELLLLNLQIIDINVVEIGRSERNLNKLNGRGWGIYSLYSLFNHSCFPNIFFYHHGSTIILRANSTIRQGEQCFISYGLHYKSVPKIDRQSILRDKYYFNCICIACRENWTNSGKLQGIKSLYYDNIFGRFLNHDVKFANEMLPQLLRILRETETSAPSVEMNQIQGLIIDYYQLFETVQEL